MKKIRTIEKTPVFNEPFKKLRVCAYVRVSTNQAEQQESFSAQVQHYTSYINKIQNGPFQAFIATRVYPARTQQNDQSL
ncbi:hypothetical protein [Desulfosporosinus sp. FKA]|uniref:hypothetical protein n=1 Tax=Desulfosporosinus sp. FKA TaxID=1969834 RepID=UPI000B49E0E0|nr:hypothetical protein [Desulfosporosinus sp. FKA]